MVIAETRAYQRVIFVLYFSIDVCVGGGVQRDRYVDTCFMLLFFN